MVFVWRNYEDRLLTHAHSFENLFRMEIQAELPKPSLQSNLALIILLMLV
jgi:hypothetical protein